MRWLAAVVLLTGCDLVFGLSKLPPNPDATVNDDEDNDGVPNEIDNCPGIANADQADLDGDHVGDVCDPHPAVGTDRILGVAYFGDTTIDGGWVATGPWNVVSGSATNGGDAQLMRAALGTTPTVELGFTVVNRGLPNTATLRLSIGDGTALVRCHVDPEIAGGYGIFLTDAPMSAATTDDMQRLILQTDVAGSRCTEGEALTSPDQVTGTDTTATIELQNQLQIAISYIVVYDVAP